MDAHVSLLGSVYLFLTIAGAQLLDRARLSATPRTAAHEAPLSSMVPQTLLKFTSMRQRCSVPLTISSSAAPPSFFFSLSQHQDLLP